MNKPRTTWRCRPMAMMLIAALSTSGCSVFNPYVRPSEHPYEKCGATDSKDCSLPKAIAWANEVRKEYEDALRAHAILDTTVGVSIIPVTALLSYYGIIGVGTKDMAKAALGGAAVLGGTQYLRSPARPLIYASAANAVTCAIGIMQPLAISSSELDQLKTLKDALESQINSLQAAAEDPDASNDDTKFAQDKLTAARDMASHARAAQRRFADAGYALINAVDQIRGTTNQQLTATLPDPQALTSGLGGLLYLPTTPSNIKDGAKSTPAVGPALAVEPGKGDDKTVKAAKAKQAIADFAGAIDASIIALHPYVERAQQTQSDQALKACNVDLAKLETALTLTPPGPIVRVTPGTATTRAHFITGGKPPYWAQVLTPPAAGKVEAEVVSQPGGYVVRITVDATVPKDSDIPVVIKDSSRQPPQLLTVQVK